MTALTNKIITRGFGPKRSVVNTSGPITQGYGPLAPAFVTEAFRRPGLRLGQSGTKRRLQELDEVIVWAKLVEVNRRPPPVDVSGWIKVEVNKDSGYAAVVAEHVSTRVRAAWETIKVSVSRLK